MAQALSAMSSSNGIYVNLEMTASGPQNVYHNPQGRFLVNFSAAETPYQAGLSCPVGSSPDVNNRCMCPNQASAAPFRQPPAQVTAQMMGSLFTPMEPSLMPTVAPSYVQLMQQRAPLPASFYRPLND